MSLLEFLKDRSMPLAGLMGIEFIEADREHVIATLVVRPEWCNAGESVHGGTLMAFADTIGAAGAVANLPEGKGTITLESKTNFVGRAGVGTTLKATATPVHRGGRTQIWQTRIETAEGRLVAMVTQTQLVM